MGTAKKLLDWSTGCTKASAAVLPIIALFILIIAVIAGS